MPDVTDASSSWVDMLGYRVLSALKASLWQVAGYAFATIYLASIFQSQFLIYAFVYVKKKPQFLNSGQHNTTQNSSIRIQRVLREVPYMQLR